MKIRGFEIAKGFEDKKINLPIRKTKGAAGYDIEAAEDTVIPSFKKGMNPTLVKTGVIYVPGTKPKSKRRLFIEELQFNSTIIPL